LRKTKIEAEDREHKGIVRNVRNVRSAMVKTGVIIDPIYRGAIPRKERKEKSQYR